jgi:hypothetical protein
VYALPWLGNADEAEKGDRERAWLTERMGIPGRKEVSFKAHTGSRYRVSCRRVLQNGEQIPLVCAGVSVLRAPPGARTHRAIS